MLRSQGQVLCPSDAGNPEHEPARRRLSLLTLGSRQCPGPRPARGHPPPSCPRPPASSLAPSAALVGFPRLSRADTGCHAPRSPAGADPSPQPRESANPERTLVPREEIGFSRGHLPLLLLAPLLRGRRQGPSARTYPPEVNQPYLPVRSSLENT